MYSPYRVEFNGADLGRAKKVAFRCTHVLDAIWKKCRIGEATNATCHTPNNTERQDELPRSIRASLGQMSLIGLAIHQRTKFLLEVGGLNLEKPSFAVRVFIHCFWGVLESSVCFDHLAGHRREHI